MDVVWDSSPWLTEGEAHSVQHMLQFLYEVLAHNGTIWGALNAERLVGIATYHPHLTDTMDQLVFLHVSRGYRRQGIASRLFDRIEQLARQSGAQELYVSAARRKSSS